MDKHYFLGFRKGKLVTVVISNLSEVKDALNVDYFVLEPQEPEKQIEEWKKQN